MVTFMSFLAMFIFLIAGAQSVKEQNYAGATFLLGMFLMNLVFAHASHTTDAGARGNERSEG